VNNQEAENEEEPEDGEEETTDVVSVVNKGLKTPREIPTNSQGQGSNSKGYNKFTSGALRDSKDRNRGKGIPTVQSGSPLLSVYLTHQGKEGTITAQETRDARKIDGTGTVTGTVTDAGMIADV
jgi:hypothetical protein